jgi:hypothetical protein
MKKLFFILAAIGLAFTLNAQNKPKDLNTVKERLQQQTKLQRLPVTRVLTDIVTPRKSSGNTLINHVSHLNKSSVAQTLIGTTTYDFQTNGSVQNRIYKKNGMVGASWIYSMDLGGSYPDRGTGYSYFDGSSWSGTPTGRIETDRRGWGTLLHLDNGGEFVMSHSTTAAMAQNSRPVAGTGSWTQTNCPLFPNGEFSMYPKTAPGGPDGNTVHVIDISSRAQFGGAPVNGLDGCLNYSRSLDGGQNWDIVRAIPAGIDDTEYFGISPDDYALDAKDNIVAFTVGTLEYDWTLYKSTDNGSTFTQTVIMDFPFTKYDAATQITDVDGDGIADTVMTTDGSYSILIDNNGMVHVFGGAMFILDDDPAGLLSYFPATDGLLYWNESMGSNPPVVIATSPDLDGDGVAASFANDLGGIYANTGICSMMSSGIDATGNIYVSYCPLIEGTDDGAPSPLSYSYRNVYLMASVDGGNTWGDGYNVSNSIFDEAVYCNIAREVDNCVSMIWQQDGTPGNVLETPAPGHPIVSNDIIYDCVDVNLVLGLNETILTENVSVVVFPNPASDKLTLKYSVNQPMEIIVEIRNVMGQLVGTYFNNITSKGTHSLNIDISNLDSGLYVANTIINKDVYATRFIKQ